MWREIVKNVKYEIYKLWDLDCGKTTDIHTYVVMTQILYDLEYGDKP